MFSQCHKWNPNMTWYTHRSISLIKLPNRLYRYIALWRGWYPRLTGTVVDSYSTLYPTWYGDIGLNAVHQRRFVVWFPLRVCVQVEQDGKIVLWEATQHSAALLWGQSRRSKLLIKFVQYCLPLLVLRSINRVRAWHTIGRSSTLSLRALPRMRAIIGNEVLRSVGSKQNLGSRDQIWRRKNHPESSSDG